MPVDLGAPLPGSNTTGGMIFVFPKHVMFTIFPILWVINIIVLKCFVSILYWTACYAV